ncbi:GNAT family N-acetyltransferase [Ruminococcus sp. 5_1_39BFAA]|uniref:GNAT family N-acetyltransferase n=1 Tax=Ruminococcus sp. 5_1_39BFAA TaxID=457412 RepID=UPI003568E91C
MNELNWNVVEHKDLSGKTRNSIAELKNQHWSYGIKSQIDWMNKNIQADDYHLLGVDSSGVLRAYLTLVHIQVKYDGKDDDALGIGGVSVDKSVEHSGIGKQLVSVANAYIKKKGKMGLLLCKDRLTEFYKKCEWVNVDCKIAYVDGQTFENVVMIYPHELKCESISIDRNF